MIFEVRKIINDSPNKSCLLDFILTFLLKDCLDGNVNQFMGLILVNRHSAAWASTSA